ncbi:hypothetical protein [Frankia nepalensis]|uniref:Uncharacterized protein n=1 Tax=Frankia nepalensis TaxID=1836974 RepID=A0A937RHJ7_9ACTN|nr:hypothetical protein [Frankia nepalensis]MBL7514974.1 hypothetical protein [Frankia nepalensis]MBL7629095.1 hypothetical protein [Frankia nepalensis]
MATGAPARVCPYRLLGWPARRIRFVAREVAAGGPWPAATPPVKVACGD